MTDVLKVNKADLEAQIDNLENLYNSTDLKTKIDGLQSFAVSSGDCVSVIKEFNTELTSLNSAMKLLFGNTLSFLKNTHQNFIQADEG